MTIRMLRRLMADADGGGGGGDAAGADDAGGEASGDTDGDGISEVFAKAAADAEAEPEAGDGDPGSEDPGDEDVDPYAQLDELDHLSDAKPDDDPDDPEAEPDDKTGKEPSRAEKRIRNLTAERDFHGNRAGQSAQQVQALQGQLQQYDNALKQQQQANQELQQQQAVMAKELELVSDRSRQIDEEKLDPYGKMKLEMRRDLEDEFQTKYDKRFDDIDARDEAREQAAAQAESKAARKGRVDGYRQESDEATRRMLGPIYEADPELAEKLRGTLHSHVLNMAVTGNGNMLEAAKSFHDAALGYVRGLRGSIVKTNKTKRETSKRAPGGLPAKTKPPARGRKKTPPAGELKQMGTDALGWRFKEAVSELA